MVHSYSTAGSHLFGILSSMQKTKLNLVHIFGNCDTFGNIELYYFLGQYNSISGEEKGKLGKNLSTKYPLPCLILQKNAINVPR